MSTSAPNEPFAPGTITLFVYGTLKRGGHNHGLLEQRGATYLGPAVLKRAALWDLGAFPAVTAGHGRVVGELYQLDPAALQVVDQLEGVPRFYQRTERAVLTAGGLVRAWVYTMLVDQVAAMGATRIAGGQW